MKNIWLALGMLGCFLFTGTANAEVWFEDQFEGDELGADWTIRNPNEENYLVENGVLTILVPDKTPGNAEKTPNILMLKRPAPKGDWTMTVHFRFNPQTMSEELWTGLAKEGGNGLFGIFYLYTDNYARTTAYVQTFKQINGKSSKFDNNLFWIESRNLQTRSKIWTDNVEAVELRLSKKGRRYEAAVRLLPASGAKNGPKGEWIPTRPITSLRPPGDRFVLFFASPSSGYIPKGGEALVEIDWVRIETP